MPSYIKWRPAGRAGGSAAMGRLLLQSESNLNGKRNSSQTSFQIRSPFQLLLRQMARQTPPAPHAASAAFQRSCPIGAESQGSTYFILRFCNSAAMAMFSLPASMDHYLYPGEVVRPGRPGQALPARLSRSRIAQYLYYT